MKRLLVLTMVFSLMFFIACSMPAQRMNKQASQLGFVRQLLQGTAYTHVAYWNASADRSGLLHVYLDGDGTPWLYHSRIAADPTPRNPLVLRLMAQDEAPSLYLGRPCYHGQSDTPSCSPLLWTARRYGPEVVDSMVAALEEALVQTAYDGIVLIGYSGGGALAMLLAERLEQTQGVLTIAGNLDPERWAARHGYSPLYGSLNPASRPPLKPSIPQLHLAGGRDKNMPMDLIRRVVLQQPSAKFILMDTFDHTCCWQATWPFILAQWESIWKGNRQYLNSK